MSLVRAFAPAASDELTDPSCEASAGNTLKAKSNVEPARPLPEGNVLLPVVKVPLMPAPLASVIWVLPGVPNELPV
ncbi:MAG TPA: hypothetical protein VGG30_03870, partial [Pirellulales bacterium]